MGQFKKYKKNAIPILNRISTLFPEYTEHDITHSNEVIKNLDILIHDDIKKSLNSYELYILLSSAYLHDIGMVHFPDIMNNECYEKFEHFKLEKISKDEADVDDKDILKDFIRKNHHLISEKYIEKYYSNLGIYDHNYAFFIKRNCRGHRQSKLSDANIFPYNEGIDGKTINLPLLCAFLEIADELDLTYKRTPLVIWNTIRPTQPISQEEWIKSLVITSFHFDTDDSTQLLITARFRTDLGLISKKLQYNILISLLNIESKIQERFRELPRHLHELRKKDGYDRLLPKLVYIKINGLYLKDFIKATYPKIKGYI